MIWEFWNAKWVWKYKQLTISELFRVQWTKRISNSLLGYFYKWQIIVKNGVFEDTMFKMCDHLQILLSLPLSHLYFQGRYQETVGG